MGADAPDKICGGNPLGQLWNYFKYNKIMVILNDKVGNFIMSTQFKMFRPNFRVDYLKGSKLG